MRKVFIDVTDIMRYIKSNTTISGIQRVSLEVIRRMVKEFGTDTVKLCFLDEHVRSYVATDADFLNDMDGFDAALLRKVFVNPTIAKAKPVPPMLGRYYNKPVKYWYHWMRTSLNEVRGNEAFFRRKNMTIAEWQAQKKTCRENTVDFDAEIKPLQKNRQPLTDAISPGDQIVVLGANWGDDLICDCLRELSQIYKAKVVFFIHDLIPIKTPEYVGKGADEEFYRWLKTSATYCDHYLANSHYTAKDLREFLTEHGHDHRIEVVQLAQDLGHNSGDGVGDAAIAQDIVDLTKDPYVLVVGTIEMRKNLWRLVRVWERISQITEGGAPRLILAGKSSKMDNNFYDWLDADGYQKDWVHIVNKPSDEELAYLYRNCDFTAMVSAYEGWGLPIGESLSFGKTAVVAHNSSMPEVGGDMVEYCDAMSEDSIYKAVHRLITDNAHRRMLETRIKGATLRTWDDVVSDLIEKLSHDI